MEETHLTPGIKDNTRLFQSFTAVAGTVWIRLPANLLPSTSQGSRGLLAVNVSPPGINMGYAVSGLVG